MHFMDSRFVNLGEEVILTLIWQYGVSVSATVCFVISSSIYYWLFKCGVLRIVCVCVCVCVCVWERERERVTVQSPVCVCVCACVCLWEREETRSHNRGLCANTYEHHHHCIYHATLFPFSPSCSFGLVVEHCVSSAKVSGLNSREHTYWQLNAVDEKTCPASSSMQLVLLQDSVFRHAAMKNSTNCVWSYFCANIHQTNPECIS